MRSIKLSVGIISALAFCIAMAASASAASFLSSAKAKLESLNVATQKFVTDQGTVECSKAAISAGESTGAEATGQAATVKYEGCKAFGFVNVDITPAEYVFMANGEARITKLISINVLGVGCEISVPAQDVKSVDYQTKGNNILLEPLVTGIKYTAGSGCSPSGNLANGTYSGHSEAMIPNGTLSFMSSGEASQNVLSETEANNRVSYRVIPPVERCKGNVTVENTSNVAATITVLKENGIECNIKTKGCEAKALINNGAFCRSLLEPLMGAINPRYETEVEWNAIKFKFIDLV